MSNIYYLSHGGPGSGRYPWGSGDRPYQRLEGSRKKSSGGISEYIKSRKIKKIEEQKQKAAEEAKRKADQEKERKLQLERDKDKILKSGSASEILTKYQGELTNKELSEVAERIRLENQLKSYSSQEIKSGLDKLKTVQSYTNVGSALAKDGIEIWNSFVSVYNATQDGKGKPLPFIGRSDGGGNKKK